MKSQTIWLITISILLSFTFGCDFFKNNQRKEIKEELIIDTKQPDQKNKLSEKTSISDTIRSNQEPEIKESNLSNQPKNQEAEIIDILKPPEIESLLQESDLQNIVNSTTESKPQDAPTYNEISEINQSEIENLLSTDLFFTSDQPIFSADLITDLKLGKLYYFGNSGSQKSTQVGLLEIGLYGSPILAQERLKKITTAEILPFKVEIIEFNYKEPLKTEITIKLMDLKTENGLNSLSYAIITQKENALIVAIKMVTQEKQFDEIINKELKDLTEIAISKLR